jgi:NTE family protein
MSIDSNLVLSGGGARAYAHLGAIKALHEKNINFNAISATSAGSIVAAFLCDGFSIEEIIRLASENTSLINFNFSLKQGLLSSDKLERFLKTNLRSVNIENLQKSLFISATNLNDGKQRIFNSGSIIDAVLASASIPLLFKPLVIDGNPYADGAISSNLPIEPFIDSQLKTIAIHVNPIDTFDINNNISQQIERLFHLCVKEKTESNSKKIDLFLEPPLLTSYGLFDLKKFKELIEIGYNYTKNRLETDAFAF